MTKRRLSPYFVVTTAADEGDTGPFGRRAAAEKERSLWLKPGGEAQRIRVEQALAEARAAILNGDTEAAARAIGSLEGATPEAVSQERQGPAPTDAQRGG